MAGSKEASFVGIKSAETRSGWHPAAATDTGIQRPPAFEAGMGRCRVENARP